MEPAKSSHRVINFNPGPAALPLAALERARDELIDFQGSGMSIMEHSHRGKVYAAVQARAEELLTRLLQIPPSHGILFLSGGATTHFAQVPMNFLRAGQSADYVLTDHWSEKARDEATFYGTARTAASTREPDGRFRRVPRSDEVKVDRLAAYLHTTSNNTLMGTQFHPPPAFGAVPQVCDMSSDFLSRPTDVAKFDFIYAGAQKNVGASGLVLAIVRRAFLATGRTDIPKIFRYQVQFEADSLYNTPNTFGVYLSCNVLEWIDAQGGLRAIDAVNRAKAQSVYEVLDAAKEFYRSPVEVASRSLMNVVFYCPSNELDSKFVEEAASAGMVGLKGHRLTGGLRASLYNAVSLESARTLADFMKSFARANA